MVFAVRRAKWHDGREGWDDIIVRMDRAAFEADDRTYDAVLRNLEIIGEAAKNRPREARDLTPDIEWPKIGGFSRYRSACVFGIDKAILWDIVAQKVPELLSAMRRASGG